MNPEQEQLITKAQDSLKAARVLANEGLYDFAISRAYYTMFYVAEAFLLSEGLSFSKHSAVIAELLNTPKSDLREYSPSSDTGLSGRILRLGGGNF